MLHYPTTLEEARQTRYGSWSGNPNGHKYVDGRCAYEVHDAGRGVLFHQCNHANGHGACNLYCKHHAQILDMIPRAPAKPRRKSYVDTLVDRIHELQEENKSLKVIIEEYERRLGGG